VLLRPIPHAPIIPAQPPRAVRWQDMAATTRKDAKALTALVEARQQLNPKLEAYTTEAARHFGAGLASTLMGALAGLILGLAAGVGAAIAGAVAARPLITIPPLATFILALGAQTVTFRGALGADVIGAFLTRAAWAAIVVLLAAAVADGVLHRRYR